MHAAVHKIEMCTLEPDFTLIETVSLIETAWLQGQQMEHLAQHNIQEGPHIGPTVTDSSTVFPAGTFLGLTAPQQTILWDMAHCSHLVRHMRCLPRSAPSPAKAKWTSCTSLYWTMPCRSTGQHRGTRNHIVVCAFCACAYFTSLCFLGSSILIQTATVHCISLKQFAPMINATMGSAGSSTKYTSFVAAPINGTCFSAA